MAKEAYSQSSIARAVYDSTAEAIRTSGKADIVDAGAGANNSVNETIPNSSTEIGSNAGSRMAGIIIILQDANDLYINIGASAGTGDAKLTTDGESIFLPTNDSVYGLSAEAGGSAISYIEI